MIYSNYIRSYNNMVSRMSRLNNANNYMSALNGMNNNSYNSNRLLNEVLNRKYNNYVNNIKEFSKYDKESKEFYNEFKEKFSQLKDSASKLKSYSSDSVFVKKYETKDTEKAETKVSENKNTDPKKVKEDPNAKIVDAVEKFASSYNDAVTFLNNNSNKSQKVNDLAESYTSIVKYNKSTLSGIGVNVDANGKLTVDKDKLANAIRENKNAVRNALGNSTSGVANKVYNKTTVAMIQSKELYPASKLKNDYIKPYKKFCVN